MDGGEVQRAASACQTFLGGTVDRDWTRPIPGMAWTVADAADVAAGPRELSVMELRMRPETPPPDLVAALGSSATVLARVIDGAAPARVAGTRTGWRTPPGSRPWPATSCWCTPATPPVGWTCRSPRRRS